MEFREEWALPSQGLRLQFRVLEFQLCSTPQRPNTTPTRLLY